MIWFAPGYDPLDIFFEVGSAMGNVGLNADIISNQFPHLGKMLDMVLMWVGRLEILPAWILVMSLPKLLLRKTV